MLKLVNQRANDFMFYVSAGPSSHPRSRACWTLCRETKSRLTQDINSASHLLQSSQRIQHQQTLQGLFFKIKGRNCPGCLHIGGGCASYVLFFFCGLKRQFALRGSFRFLFSSASRAAPLFIFCGILANNHVSPKKYIKNPRRRIDGNNSVQYSIDCLKACLRARSYFESFHRKCFYACCFCLAQACC